MDRLVFRWRSPALCGSWADGLFDKAVCLAIVSAALRAYFRALSDFTWNETPVRIQLDQRYYI